MQEKQEAVGRRRVKKAREGFGLFSPKQREGTKGRDETEEQGDLQAKSE